MSPNKVVLAFIAAVFAAAASHAEVLDSSAGGFTVKTTVTISAAPSVVYSKLVNVGDWWDPAHTFSNDAHNLSIEQKPMGCYCEKLPGRGAVRHMEVIYFERGKTLRMSGAIGPLQGLAVTGVLTVVLTPAEGGTKLEATYTVGGYLAGGITSWAAPVDSVISEQFARLKRYIETGSPAAKGK